MATNDPSYFQHRLISAQTYAQYSLPPYLEGHLPAARESRILDFGCGFGQFVRALAALGYTGVTGYDIEPAAIEFCRANDLPIIDGRQHGLAELTGAYDFIFSSHVIEHIPKEQVIDILTNLRRLLKPTGKLFICVPNAQSNTGSYWAYEDFTHHTAYTSGSLYYVLSKAGFSEICFVDRTCTEGLPPARRAIKLFFLAVYEANYKFWNRVTGSATHASSPNIFSYEIKVVAAS